MTGRLYSKIILILSLKSHERHMIPSSRFSSSPFKNNKQQTECKYEYFVNPRKTHFHIFLVSAYRAKIQTTCDAILSSCRNLMITNLQINHHAVGVKSLHILYQDNSYIRLNSSSYSSMLSPSPSLLDFCSSQ